MATTSLPSFLLLLLTTAQLLLGGGQAAYLQYPGAFPEDSPAGRVQYYEPSPDYPLREDKAEYQLSETYNQYRPQGEPMSPSGGVQYYEPFRNYPVKEDEAENQFFENHNQYQPQDELSPGGEVQYYAPFHDYPMKENKAENQLFENHNQYQPQGEPMSPTTAEVESLLSEAEEIASVSSDTCADEYEAQLKKLVDMKQSCSSAGFHDCCQVKKLIPTVSSGIFDFKIFCGAPCEPFSSEGTDSTLKAPCDMDTDGGGWMVIQRRAPNGTVNFTRDWEDYENGFGDLSGEFWYGLRNLHCLTAREEVELRIDMVTESTNTRMWWSYQTFKVAGAGDKYRLTIGGGKGSVGKDAMAYHNGMQFTTYDQDNDKWSPNCAYFDQGGWWYNQCFHANLNGPHDTPSWPGVSPKFAKLLWYDGSTWLELSSVEMKIRAKKCHE